MKPCIEFVKTTLIGGLLFLIPVVLVVLLVHKALSLAGSGLAPVAHLLPTQSVVGIAVAQVVAVCALLFVCFMAGLAIRTRTGAHVNAQLEQVILRRVPGFTFVKNIAQGLAGLESGSELSVALARIEDAWGLSFVVERHAGGLFTVFVPSAPTPAAGSIYYLTEDRLKLLDVPVSTAMGCIMRLGIGSHALLDSRRSWSQNSSIITGTKASKLYEARPRRGCPPMFAVGAVGHTEKPAVAPEEGRGDPGADRKFTRPFRAALWPRTPQRAHAARRHVARLWLVLDRRLRIG
jgi:uncharacterized membrane protein